MRVADRRGLCDGGDIGDHHDAEGGGYPQKDVGIVVMTAAGR